MNPSMHEVAQNESLRVLLAEDGTIGVVGEIDLAGGPLLDQVVAAREAAGDHVTIEMSQVTFVDSSGLRSLIAASQRATAAGRRVRLVAPSAVVVRLLDITATTSMFDIDEAS